MLFVLQKVAKCTENPCTNLKFVNFGGDTEAISGYAAKPNCDSSLNDEKSLSI
ncbi:MAG: hypothetical protein RR033_03150 [Clostridia bacterium]